MDEIDEDRLAKKIAAEMWRQFFERFGRWSLSKLLGIVVMLIIVVALYFNVLHVNVPK